MVNIYQISLTLATSTVLGFAVCLPAGAATLYSIASLGSLGADRNGFNYSTPLAINNNGQVAGSSTSSKGTRAFLWDKNQGMQNLGVLRGGQESVAYGINNNGQLVGYSTDFDQTSAFVWDKKRGMQKLGFLDNSQGKYSYSEAMAINDKGQVVGFSSSSNGERAFLWDKKQGMQDLGIFSSGSFGSSQANDINNEGQVVGYADTYTGDRAFIWERNQGLQSLGVKSGYPQSQATAINTQGQVVGYLYDYAGRNPKAPTRAFVWDKTNGMKDLGVLDATSSGVTYSQATDINRQGQVVGYSSSKTGSVGFLWENDMMQNLNDLISPNSGWTLYDAWGINDTGAIIGSGALNGQSQAFLLTPAKGLSQTSTSGNKDDVKDTAYTEKIVPVTPGPNPNVTLSTSSQSIPESSTILALLSVAAFGFTCVSGQQNQHKTTQER